MNNKFTLDINYKKSIPYDIFNRGLAYYNQKRVTGVRIDSDKVTAIVRGTRTYRVTIILDKDGSFNAACTCPFSERGAYICKHVAAVLIHIDNHEEKVNPIESDLVKKEFEKVINMPLDNYRVMRNYPYQIQVALREYINIINKNSDKEYVFNNIYFCVSKILSINTYLPNYIVSNIFSFIKTPLEKLMIEDEYYNSFITLLLNTDSINKDFASECIEVLIKYTDNQNRALTFLNNSKSLNITNSIMKAIVFLTYKYKDKDSAVDFLLEATKKYLFMNCIDEFIELLKSRNDKERLIKIYENLICISSIRERYIDILLNIYIESNYLQKAKELIIDKFIKSPSVKNYNDIKELYSSKEEWEDLKSVLLNNIEKSPKVAVEIYVIENELDKAMTILKELEDIELLDKHHKYFIKGYAYELLELYSTAIISALVHGQHGQSDFSGIVRKIENMIKIPNSKEKVQILLDKLILFFRPTNNFKEDIVVMLIRNNLFNEFNIQKRDVYSIDVSFDAL